MRIGIIDIGYNAIRAVVYKDNRLGALEIYSATFKNDIFSLLGNSDLDIKHQTYLVINHIKTIFTNLKVSQIRCISTSILRDHPRANKLVEFIKTKYDIDIEIVSGALEAELSALGLISATSNTNGVACDLGGGSLEMVHIIDRKIQQLKSLPLGIKVISIQKLDSVDLLVNKISDEYPSSSHENLYLIGGSLRLLGRLYVEGTGDNLRNLHNYSIAADKFNVFLDNLLSNEKDHQTAAINGRRLNKNSILIAKALMLVLQPKKVVISTYGLKEGAKYQLLPAAERDKNILIERVLSLFGQNKSDINIDKHIIILGKLLSSSRLQYNNVPHLVHTVMLFAKHFNLFDSSLPVGPMHDFVMSCNVPFTREQRLMTTLSLSFVRSSNPDKNISNLSKRILSKAEYQISQIIGSYVRICQEVDGPEFINPSFDIEETSGYLEIKSDRILPRFIFDIVKERLKTIAFGLKSS